MQRYEDSERAIEQSGRGMCLSRDYFDVTNRFGTRYRARIMRRGGHDYCFVFATMPSIRIEGVSPSSSEIDRVRQWEAF